MKRFEGLVLCAALAGVAGCSGSAGSTPAPGPSTSGAPPTNPIQHVVILVQENRSFNNVFAGFPGANTALQGPCTPSRRCSGSHMVTLHSVNLATGIGPNKGKDIDHTNFAFKTECDATASNVCRMDGFNLIHFGESGQAGPAYTYPYAYIDRKETKPYWNLAHQYTLADAMFFTETASSFIAHQMLISGTVKLNGKEAVTNEPVQPPWGCDSFPGDNAPIIHSSGHVRGYPGIFPCFTWATIADLMDAKHVSWLDYVDQCCQKLPFDFSGGVWNGFRAIHKIFYGPDWKTHISSPNTTLFSDIKAGTLPSVSWVIPTLYDSDHPASGCNGGPWWVTKVVNALGTSPYWKNVAIIVLWDDWGGWYDNAPPPHINFHQLGMRVPMIVISPWAKPGYVSHTQYDFGSILRFTEDTFGLGTLGTTDKSAPSMDDVFDFSQSPNTFTPAPEPSAMPCKKKVTNPKGGQQGMEELIDHDGGVPE